MMIRLARVEEVVEQPTTQKDSGTLISNGPMLQRPELWESSAEPEHGTLLNVRPLATTKPPFMHTLDSVHILKTFEMHI